MNEQNHEAHSRRDAASMQLLGFFFSVLATLVLIGTFWTLDRPRAMTVNIAAGVALLCIGLGMIWGGRRLGNSLPAEDSSTKS